MDKYLFESDRLGFRIWEKSDAEGLFQMNSNPQIMRFFPSLQTRTDAADFISRMNIQYQEFGYCYFAVDELKSKNFVGFIGLSNQTFKANFNPSVDIGWRLLSEFWGIGYATEGAKRCLVFAKEQLSLSKIVSVAPIINLPSISVMNKIGMKKVLEFEHPLLNDSPELKKCLLYYIKVN